MRCPNYFLFNVYRFPPGGVVAVAGTGFGVAGFFTTGLAAAGVVVPVPGVVAGLVTGLGVVPVADFNVAGTVDGLCAGALTGGMVAPVTAGVTVGCPIGI
jgi:hypothetical protein